MSNESDLTELVIKERVKGLSYYDIEKKHSIPALEAREMVREALASTSIEDEWEQRGIMMLRIEKVIENLWSGVERGEFKHAEAMFKGIEQLSNLLALNKQVIETQQAEITDAQAAIIYAIVTANNKMLYEKILEELTQKELELEVLKVWPQITADAATDAVESVLYVDVEEDE